jgi:hypothetical protein
MMGSRKVLLKKICMELCVRGDKCLTSTYFQLMHEFLFFLSGLNNKVRFDQRANQLVEFF